MPNVADMAKAKAFAVWVKNAIGVEPQIFISDDPETVEIVWTPETRDRMIAYLDSLMWDQKESPLKLGFDQVLIPWALKYLVPGAAATFFAGYATKGMRGIGKRFRLW